MSRGITSIIIPAYNAERTIEKCLVSIFAQTYLSADKAGRDLQIVVVDDASSDGTWALLQSIKNQESQIKNYGFDLDSLFMIHHSVNQGAQAARNKGWGEVQNRCHSDPPAGGEESRPNGRPPFVGDPSATPQDDKRAKYMLFCDADIVLKPDCLEKMVRALEAHPEASYAYSSFKFGWKKFKLWPFNAVKLRQMPYIHTTSLIRAEHFPATGWDESVKRLQDWDLWLTMLEQGHTGVWIPETIFTVIDTRGTMSRWIPAFLHKWPFKRLTLQVEPFKRYNEAVARIKEKHHLK